MTEIYPKGECRTIRRDGWFSIVYESRPFGQDIGESNRQYLKDMKERMRSDALSNVLHCLKDVYTGIRPFNICYELGRWHNAGSLTYENRKKIEDIAAVTGKLNSAICEGLDSSGEGLEGCVDKKTDGQTHRLTGDALRQYVTDNLDDLNRVYEVMEAFSSQVPRFRMPVRYPDMIHAPEAISQRSNVLPFPDKRSTASEEKTYASGTEQ